MSKKNKEIEKLTKKNKKLEKKLKKKIKRMDEFLADVCTTSKLKNLEDSVPEENLLDCRESGFLFGLKADSCTTDCYIGKKQDADGNILVVGGPGTCKTTALVIPSMATWTGRIIALDIKGKGGDLVTPWRELRRRKMKKRLKVFNPAQPDCAHYDPYALLRRGGEEQLIQNARELALSILPKPINLHSDPVWIELAQNLLTAAILHYYEIGASFNDTMVAVQKHSVSELLGKISDTEDAQLFVSKFKDLKPEILAGIGMDFGRFVALAVDPFVNGSLSVDENTNVFDWADFLSDDTEYDVILQIPETRLEQWEPVVTLILNQLIRTLEKRPDQHNLEEEEVSPLLVLLDEFPRLGKCDTVKSGLSTLRSRGVTFALFVQSLSQLDERYGKYGRQSILSCCPYQAILGVCEPEEQEYFSQAIGKITNSSITGNKNRLIEPEELGQLDEQMVLITPRGPCCVQKKPYYTYRQEPFLP